MTTGRDSVRVGLLGCGIVGGATAHDETFAELETLDSVRSIDSRLRVVGTAEA